MKKGIIYSTIRQASRFRTALFVFLMLCLSSFNGLHAQYCDPFLTTGTAQDDYIDGVQMGFINNVGSGGTGAPYYSDFTAQSTTVLQGDIATIVLTNGTFGDNGSIFAVFVDYNHDNDFNDPGEQVAATRAATASTDYFLSFSIPYSALTGPTRMRVRYIFDLNNNTNVDPCADYTWGETEDYTLNIQPNPTPAYCTPTHATGGMDGDFIAGVQMGTINNPTPVPNPSPSYSDFTGFSTTVNQNQTVVLQLTNGFFGSAFNFFEVYVDFDQNFDFAGPGERVARINTPTANTTYFAVFNIPATAALGATRMRIRQVYDDTGAPNLDPCGNYQFGETEDYTLVISNNPVADFVSDINIVRAGRGVNYTNLSTNAPLALWRFEGTTPNTSTVYNPANVIYDTPGQYGTLLIATTGTVNDTMVKPNYILVVDPNSCTDLYFPVQNPSQYTTAQGFLFGHNEFQLAEFANFFNAEGDANLESISFQFGHAESTTPASSNITVRVYDNDGAGGSPGTVLATGQIPYSQIIADVNAGDASTFVFPTPLAVNGGFYVSFELSYGVATDSLALLSEPVNTTTTNNGYILLPGAAGGWALASNVLNNVLTTRLGISARYCPTVINPPVADFVASATTVTVGQVVGLTDLSTESPTNWSWSIAPANFNYLGGTTATTQNPAVEFTQPGQYTVTLTATNGIGSDSETKTFYITVLPAPPCDTLNFPTPIPSTYLAGNTAAEGYIPGHNVYQIGNFASYFTGTTGQTHLNGALFAFAMAKSLTPATSRITARVYAANGPGGTPGAVLAQQDIFYNQIIADVLANQPTLATFGGPVALPPTGGYYVAFQCYYGTPGDTVQLFTDELNHPIINSGFMFVTGSGWVPLPLAIAGLRSAEFSIFPIVGSAPVAAYTPSVTQVCPGGSVTFTNTSTNATSFVWSFPGGTPATSTDVSPVVTYNTEGVFDVQLIATSPCGGSNTVTNVGQITVGPTPAGSLSATPNTVCQTISQSTIAYAGTAAPGATFAWNFDGGVAFPGSGFGPHQVSWSTTGTKTVTLTVTNPNGCVSNQLSVNVTVTPTLAPPVVTCAAATDNSVTFTWNDLGAPSINYTVSIDGGGFVPANNLAGPRTHVVGGLLPNTSVTAIVSTTGVGQCGIGQPSAPVVCTSGSPTTAQLSAIVLLQGPYNAGSMSTLLNAGGILPLNQPFNAAPYNYTGTEAVAAHAANTVDWVLVELRDAANIFTVVERRAAVVLSNGQLRAPDGVAALNFAAAPGNYFVTIKHRSHLSITSAAPVALPNLTPLDLSDAANLAGGANFAANVGGGRVALPAGDMTSDGFVTQADYANWYQYNSAIGVYLDADLNMDGFVTVADYTLWLGNNSRFSYLD